MRTTHERYLCERAGSDASTIRDADTSVGDSGILVVEVLRRVVATSGCGARKLWAMNNSPRGAVFLFSLPAA